MVWEHNVNARLHRAKHDVIPTILVVYVPISTSLMFDLWTPCHGLLLIARGFHLTYLAFIILFHASLNRLGVQSFWPESTRESVSVGMRSRGRVQGSFVAYETHHGKAAARRSSRLTCDLYARCGTQAFAARRGLSSRG